MLMEADVEECMGKHTVEVRSLIKDEWSMYSMYMYMYTYIYTYIHTYVYIYIYMYTHG